MVYERIIVRDDSQNVEFAYKIEIIIDPTAFYRVQFKSAYNPLIHDHPDVYSRLTGSGKWEIIQEHLEESPNSWYKIERNILDPLQHNGWYVLEKRTPMSSAWIGVEYVQLYITFNPHAIRFLIRKEKDKQQYISVPAMLSDLQSGEVDFSTLYTWSLGDVTLVNKQQNAWRLNITNLLDVTPASLLFTCTMNNPQLGYSFWLHVSSGVEEITINKINQNAVLGVPRFDNMKWWSAPLPDAGNVQTVLAHASFQDVGFIAVSGQVVIPAPILESKVYVAFADDKVLAGIYVVRVEDDVRRISVQMGDEVILDIGDIIDLKTHNVVWKSPVYPRFNPNVWRHNTDIRAINNHSENSLFIKFRAVDPTIDLGVYEARIQERKQDGKIYSVLFDVTTVLGLQEAPIGPLVAADIEYHEWSVSYMLIRMPHFYIFRSTMDHLLSSYYGGFGDLKLVTEDLRDKLALGGWFNPPYLRFVPDISKVDENLEYVLFDPRSGDWRVFRIDGVLNALWSRVSRGTPMLLKEAAVLAYLKEHKKKQQDGDASVFGKLEPTVEKQLLNHVSESLNAVKRDIVKAWIRTQPIYFQPTVAAAALLRKPGEDLEGVEEEQVEEMEEALEVFTEIEEREEEQEKEERRKIVKSKKKMPLIPAKLQTAIKLRSARTEEFAQALLLAATVAERLTLDSERVVVTLDGIMSTWLSAETEPRSYPDSFMFNESFNDLYPVEARLESPNTRKELLGESLLKVHEEVEGVQFYRPRILASDNDKRLNIVLSNEDQSYEDTLTLTELFGDIAHPYRDDPEEQRYVNESDTTLPVFEEFKGKPFLPLTRAVMYMAALLEDSSAAMFAVNAELLEFFSLDEEERKIVDVWGDHFKQDPNSQNYDFATVALAVQFTREMDWTSINVEQLCTAMFALKKREGDVPIPTSYYQVMLGDGPLPRMTIPNYTMDPSTSVATRLAWWMATRLAVTIPGKGKDELILPIPAAPSLPPKPRSSSSLEAEIIFGQESWDLAKMGCEAALNQAHEFDKLIRQTFGRAARFAARVSTVITQLKLNGITEVGNADKAYQIVINLHTTIRDILNEVFTNIIDFTSTDKSFGDIEQGLNARFRVMKGRAVVFNQQIETVYDALVTGIITARDQIIEKIDEERKRTLVIKPKLKPKPKPEPVIIPEFTTVEQKREFIIRENEDLQTMRQILEILMTTEDKELREGFQEYAEFLSNQKILKEQGLIPTEA